MNLRDFISGALALPSDYLSYHVSQRLAGLFPEKSIVEGSACEFDLEAFVSAGHCSVIRDETVHNQFETKWEDGGKLVNAAQNAVLNVLWRDSLLDVFLLTFHDDGYKTRWHWIVADTGDIAEDFFRAVCDWCSEVRGEILVFDGGFWRKDEELFRSIKGASFDQLTLPRSLKEEILSDFLQFFSSNALYEKHGIPWKRGVLLIGPPGNGKTQALKALINQSARPCLYVKSFDARYDTSQGNMRRVFARAREASPCILVLEDLDSLINRKNRAFFLNELDGFASNHGLMVVATTNHPKRLDPAILDRPSRFDRKYYFSLPRSAERRAYLAAWNDSLQPEMRASEWVIAKLIRRTRGFSYAYLKELFLSASIQWISTAGQSGMDGVLRERAKVLRKQMASAASPSPDEEREEDDD